MISRQLLKTIIRYIRLKYIRLRQAHSDFDHVFYGAYYEDLSSLRSSDDLLEHYVNHGAREGRFKNMNEARKTLQSRFRNLPAEFDVQGHQTINKNNPLTLYNDSRLERYDTKLNEGHRYKIRKKAVKISSGRDRPVVYAWREDGIGTRLITALHACIFAETFGLDFKVIWPKFDEPFYDNKLLFHSDSRDEIFSSGQFFNESAPNRGEFVVIESLNGHNILSVSDESVRLAGMDRDAVRALVGRFDAVLYNLPYPLAPFIKHEINISSEVKDLWKRISWNQEIIDSVDKISTRLHLRNCIAVHVRRGDIVNMLVKASVTHLRDIGMRQIFHRYSAISTIVNEIDRVRSDENIVVCSEDRGVVEFLKTKYGADIVYSSIDLCECSESQRAVVDLMLLSTAKCLIAPFTSYFSLCAAEVGDCSYIPLALDLSAAADELLEVVSAAIDDDERRSSVCALIYKTAAEFAPDERMRMAFQQSARAFERHDASAAADSPKFELRPD